MVSFEFMLTIKCELNFNRLVEVGGGACSLSYAWKFPLCVSVCSRMGGVCVCYGEVESSGLGLELGFESWL